MAISKVKWHGDKLIREVGLKCFQNMEKACLFLEGEIKRSISQGQPPSKPGEPPHVLWGRLRGSITHEVEKSGNEVIGRAGTNVKYAIPLEYGTSKMAARPYLRPALKKNLGKIKQLLKAK